MDQLDSKRQMSLQMSQIAEECLADEINLVRCYLCKETESLVVFRWSYTSVKLISSSGKQNFLVNVAKKHKNSILKISQERKKERAEFSKNNWNDAKCER